MLPGDILPPEFYDHNDGLSGPVVQNLEFSSMTGRAAWLARQKAQWRCSLLPVKYWSRREKTYMLVYLTHSAVSMLSKVGRNDSRTLAILLYKFVKLYAQETGVDLQLPHFWYTRGVCIEWNELNNLFRDIGYQIKVKEVS